MLSTILKCSSFFLFFCHKGADPLKGVSTLSRMCMGKRGVLSKETFLFKLVRNRKGRCIKENEAEGMLGEVILCKTSSLLYRNYKKIKSLSVWRLYFLRTAWGRKIRGNYVFHEL